MQNPIKKEKPSGLNAKNFIDEVERMALRKMHHLLTKILHVTKPGHRHERFAAVILGVMDQAGLHMDERIRPLVQIKSMAMLLRVLGCG